MTTVEITATLERFNETKGRVAYLALEIANKTRELARLLANLPAYEVGPAAQVITGMPHGTRLSDPTAETAIKLAEGGEPQEAADLRRDLDRLQREYDRAEGDVCAVNAWLIALTPSERFVIEHKLINDEYWAVVIRGYEETLNLPTSKSALKRIKSSALEKLSRVTGERGIN